MRLIRYIVVHDSGRIINPMIVDGQVMGAVAHGIGATLYEWMRFDEQGQPQTVTYGDYLLPSTDTVPPIEVIHMESPTPLNPLGVKGAAESGTIAAPAAIVSAVEDALRPFRRAHPRPAADAGTAAHIDPRGGLDFNRQASKRGATWPTTSTDRCTTSGWAAPGR